MLHVLLPLEVTPVPSYLTAVVELQFYDFSLKDMASVFKTEKHVWGKKKSVVGYFIERGTSFSLLFFFFFLIFITVLAVLRLTHRRLLEPASHWLNVIQQPALCLRWHALEMMCGEDSEERIPFIVYK